MAQVIGLGGLFFKSHDPDATRDWYRKTLGLAFDDWGGTVFLPQTAAEQPGSGTVFSPFPAETRYFEPSGSDFMFNLMVDDLDAMLARCAEAGVQPVGEIMDEPNGRFAHIMDCDGQKVELWQPKAMGNANG